MNFATTAYAAFLAVVAVTYWSVPRPVGRWVLFIASLVFYASWNPWFVAPFVILLTLNWLYGLLAAVPGKGKLAIWLAVLTDLGILGAVKYLGWMINNTSWLLSHLRGYPVVLPGVSWVLPLAISFVTFTMLAYVIDIARGHPPERRWFRYALFVTFFPHLIAGPIMRADEFLPQVNAPSGFSSRHLRYAMPLLVTGLFKKTIGDQLAPFANAAFDHPAQQTALGLWIGALAFTFQILCDFSGYTDLALGSAGLLGYRLPSNFNWPYRATSIQDFWRRWHMTLARWFRDYVYIPLGGSQRGEARYYFAMFVTWLTTGLWHGAGLTFIVWGLWNGCGLVVVRIWRRGIGSRHPMPTGLAWAITFLFVVFGWVFFRSASIGEALSYIAGMLGAADGSLLAPLLVAVVLGVAVIAQWSRLQVAVTTLAPAGSLRRYAAYGTLFAAATTMLPGFTPDFIYFQF